MQHPSVCRREAWPQGVPSSARDQGPRDSASALSAEQFVSRRRQHEIVLAGHLVGERHRIPIGFNELDPNHIARGVKVDIDRAFGIDTISAGAGLARIATYTGGGASSVSIVISIAVFTTALLLVCVQGVK